MPYASRKARPGWSASNWERPRVNGQFACDPVKPAKPHPQRQPRDLSKLRAIAMRLAKHLEDMMPPDEQKKKNAKTDSDKSGTDPDKPLHPAFDRLLGRNHGVIDGVCTLAHLVIRLIEKERETLDPSQKPSACEVQIGFTPLDEAELDRRIATELDLIASRRRAEGISR